jgi:hypothetical protein
MAVGLTQPIIQTNKLEVNDPTFEEERGSFDPMVGQRLKSFALANWQGTEINE